MAANEDDLNVTEMLIDIRERLARVEENTSHLDDTSVKADKAFSLAKENSKNIEDLKESSKWNWRTAVTAIVIPFGLFILEKLFGGN